MSIEPPRKARTYSIRELCREFKCTARSLRFYEDKGLLAPARRGLTRIYSEVDRDRLQRILRAKRVNLTLNEIGELIDLRGRDDEGLIQAAAALPMLRRRLADAERQREDLEAAIANLREACERLEGRLAAAGADRQATARPRAEGHAGRAALASAD